MRYIILLLALSLLGCKTKKDVVVDNTLATDSLVRIDLHRTFSVVDSIARDVHFSFDTLEVEIVRPAQEAVPAETLRLRAVSGRIHDQRQAHKHSVEDYNRRDTVAFKLSSSQSSAEHTASTRIYSPLSGTVVVLIIALAILTIIYRLFIKR